jgi:hypothetical protein
LAAEIGDLLEGQTNPTLAPLVKRGEVTLRLTARASEEAEAQRLLDDLEARLRDRLFKVERMLEKQRITQTASADQDVLGLGGDRHSIVVQPGSGGLWETWQARLVGTNWQASNGALFNLNTNGLRPAGWTSGDAAGLPMFPALVRFDGERIVPLADHPDFREEAELLNRKYQALWKAFVFVHPEVLGCLACCSAWRRTSAAG